MTQPKQTVAALGATVDDQRERTDFLKTVIAVVLVGALASLVFQRIVTPDQTVRMAGPLLIIGAALAARYLMALGRYRAALNLMVAGAWIAVTTVVALTNGLQAPMVVAYPLLILATGWLMGPGAAIRMASVTIALTVCLFLADRQSFGPRRWWPTLAAGCTTWPATPCSFQPRPAASSAWRREPY